MGTREELLSLFENHKGVYFSGEIIAERLSLSRAAVWKAVKGLQSEGYCIDAVRNKGYCLAVDTDILSVQGIEKYLEPICSGLKLSVFPTLDSTNTLVRDKAADGAPEGYTVIAGSQTGGRGRSGRSFYSPADTGIYLSLLLRPCCYSPSQAVRLTTMAAVAVCEAIEAVSEKKALIKWVNDIYVDNKKVCGILTEASFGLEDGFLEYAVLGVGINVSPPKGGFPPELESVASSIFDQPQNDGKNRLAAEFLNRFMTHYSLLEKGCYIQEYRNRSFVIGKRIQVILPQQIREALALDVDQDCQLLVEYENGKREYLSSGEISVKLF